MKSAAWRLLNLLTAVAVILGLVRDLVGSSPFPSTFTLVVLALCAIVAFGWYVAWRLELRQGHQRLKKMLPVDRGWLDAPNPGTTWHVEER